MVVDVAKVRVVMWMSSHRVLLFDWKKCFVTIPCLELFESSCGEQWRRDKSRQLFSLSAPHITNLSYPPQAPPLCHTASIACTYLSMCLHLVLFLLLL